MAQIPAFVTEVDRISAKYGMHVLTHGHAGDGNLHSNIILMTGEDQDEWNAKLPKMQHELYTAAKNLGGTISGEHGIGRKRKKFLPLVASGAEIEFMRRIKRAVDPNNILNPGKIFDV